MGRPRGVRAWNGLLSALEVFQQHPDEFYPYSSKYDAFLRGQSTLSVRERRGLSLFNNPGKGNCASCHPSTMIRGALPQFTDRGFIALGVPRNRRIPANADAAYFDLGLCGPTRTDLADHDNYCGRFKTPTLRNVARRGAFFTTASLLRSRMCCDFMRSATSSRASFTALTDVAVPESTTIFQRSIGAM